MSRSIHITGKNFKGLTKDEIDEQAKDSASDLNKWARKSSIKTAIKQKRKNKQ